VPGRRWRSPRTGIEFPVEWRVRAGALELELVPLMDDQESDSRFTTGAVYWEGAVRARSGGGEVGRGYLELTGYGEPLQLPVVGAASTRPSGRGAFAGRRAARPRAMSCMTTSSAALRGASSRCHKPQQRLRFPVEAGDGLQRVVGEGAQRLVVDAELARELAHLGRLFGNARTSCSATAGVVLSSARQLDGE